MGIITTEFNPKFKYADKALWLEVTVPRNSEGYGNIKYTVKVDDDVTVPRNSGGYGNRTELNKGRGKVTVPRNSGGYGNSK